MEQEQDAVRRIVSLDSGWRFRLGRVSRSWLRGKWSGSDSSVDLPHCWNERDTFQAGVNYYQGPGAYGRRFAIPAGDGDNDTLWQLRSDGFYGTGELWINGRRICPFDGQYLGLCEDVSRHLLPGRVNAMGIRLSNAYRRFVLPGKKDPDFLLCGGLAGRMWLERMQALHIDDRTLRVVCNDALSGRASVRVSVQVINALRRETGFNIRVRLISPEGAVAASAESGAAGLPAARSASFHLDLSIENPELWDIDRPALYSAQCELLAGGRVSDRAVARFGVRKAEFDGNRGFFLNGKRVFLEGANRHEFIPGFGNAIPDNLHRQDAEQMKSLGFNFVRLSHYPQHHAFLDACDESGLLVYAEIATWKSVRPGPWASAACRQLRDMILRDRNRPSVILWGFGNESRSRAVYKRMQQIAGTLDPHRATVYAENHVHRGIRRRTLRLTDVLGVNYELNRLDDAHGLSKTGSLVVSETSNCPHTQRGDEKAEMDQITALERDIDLIGKKPYAAGYALWCYADYASERRGRRKRRSGLVDAWRMPKMSASYMRARTEKTIFVHAFGDWAVHSQSSERRIHVFTNAEHLNVSIGGGTVADVPARLHTALTVRFIDSDLVVTARRGNEQAISRLIPHGAPARLALVPEEPAGPTERKDAMGVLVKVTDEIGRTAANFDGEVRVRCAGPGRPRFFAGTDTVEIASGTGRFFVTGTGEPGVLTLRCESDGLEAAEGAIEYA